MPTLLVEGWRDVCHSYSLVNQYHLLELAKSGAFSLYHRDMPCPFEQQSNPSGMPPEKAAWITGVPAWQSQPYDAVLRAYSPFNLTPDVRARVLLWMVTELDISPSNLPQTGYTPAVFQGTGGAVITPSHWSKNQIVRHGFEPDGIFVVPHGVDSDIFFPMPAEERRERRAAFGYTDEHVVFLNVGTPVWTKGLDILLPTFMRLHQQHQNVRLILKDQQSLYGLGIQTLVGQAFSSVHMRDPHQTLAAICTISGNLTLAQLRDAYCIADYYVSPYRAEGFNLPVIEAIACNTTPIVSTGGSTDDFCNPSNAILIDTTLVRNTEVQGQHLDAYLSPSEESLLEIMRQCTKKPRNEKRRDMARVATVQKFSWKHAAEQIEALAT